MVFKNRLILIFALLFTTVFTLKIFSQSLYDCNVLTKAIKSKYFLKRFTDFESTEKKYFIYDKNINFATCLNFKIRNNFIEISHDTVLENLSRDKFGKIKNKNVIFLLNVKHGVNNITLDFWRPSSGGTVSLTYELKGRKLKLVKYEIGAF